MKKNKNIIIAIALIIISIAVYIYLQKSKKKNELNIPSSQEPSKSIKTKSPAKPYWKGDRQTYDLQVKLNSLGEDLVLDGIYGAKTKEAAARHNLGFSNPSKVAPVYNLNLKQWLEAPATETEKFNMNIPANSFFNI